MPEPSIPKLSCTDCLTSLLEKSWPLLNEAQALKPVLWDPQSTSPAIPRQPVWPSTSRPCSRWFHLRGTSFAVFLLSELLLILQALTPSQFPVGNILSLQTCALSACGAPRHCARAFPGFVHCWWACYGSLHSCHSVHMKKALFRDSSHTIQSAHWKCFLVSSQGCATIITIRI